MGGLINWELFYAKQIFFVLKKFRSLFSLFLEEKGDTVVSEPPRAADPVEIRFGVVGVILVYYHVDSVDIYTPGK